MDSACRALRRRAEAAAIKNADLIVAFKRDVDAMGSKGYFDKTYSTFDISHGGARDLTLGR